MRGGMLRPVSLLRRPPEHEPDPDLDLLGAPPPTAGLGHEADFGQPPAGPAFKGPLESVFRNPALALVPVLIAVGIAVVVGLVRTPVYSAESRINVGRADVPAYTLQGTTIGNATLAASYARAVPALAVAKAAARAGKISVADASSQISGSPVPGSTLIRIDADGDSSRQARRMANASARALIAYVVKLNGRQRAKGLLSAFRSAQRRTDRARLAFRRALRRFPPASTVAERARLELLTSQLRSQALSTRVLQQRINPGVPNQLQLIQPAITASSDRSSMLGRLVLIGLAVGAVLGIALALARTNADVLRAQRAQARGRA